MEAHEAYVEAHKGYVEAHKGYVEALKGYVEAHKGYVEEDRAFVVLAVVLGKLCPQDGLASTPFRRTFYTITLTV